MSERAWQGRWAKLVLALLVAALLIAAERGGLLALFADPARARAALLDLGGWGYVAFVVAFALLQPFGVPGMVFVVVAPLVWPTPVAFALSMSGAMGASVVGFSFARLVARDWITPRIPARLAKYDEALARRAFATVFALRLVLWMPPLLHAFFGLSRVPFWTHFFGTFLGYLLPLALVSYFGQPVFDALARAGLLRWVAGAAILVVAIAALSAWRHHREALRARREHCARFPDVIQRGP